MLLRSQRVELRLTLPSYAAVLDGDDVQAYDMCSKGVHALRVSPRVSFRETSSPHPKIVTPSGTRKP